MGVIPKDHLHDVCKIGKGNKCCRYITAGKDGICCEKLNPEYKKMFDARVGVMVAKGDNCEGILPEGDK